MKLHYSLLTVAIAFITGSSMFAMDAAEVKQTEQVTLEQLNNKLDGIYKEVLKQSIDTSKPVEGSISAGWPNDYTYYATLNNGKSLKCYWTILLQRPYSKKHSCASHKEDDKFHEQEESPIFFEILEEMFKKQQKSQTK